MEWMKVEMLTSIGVHVTTYNSRIDIPYLVIYILILAVACASTEHTDKQKTHARKSILINDINFDHMR